MYYVLFFWKGVILGRIVPRRYHDHYLSGVYIIMAVTTAIKSSTSSFWLFAVAQNTEFMAYTATDIGNGLVNTNK